MGIYYCNECKDEAYVRYLRSAPWRIHDNLELSKEECQTLYDLIKNEYINYENEKGHAVINKIMAFIKEKKNG